jgi:hypothetical protein
MIFGANETILSLAFVGLEGLLAAAWGWLGVLKIALSKA